MPLKHLPTWGRQGHMQRKSCYNVENAKWPPQKGVESVRKTCIRIMGDHFLKQQARELTLEGFGLRGLREDSKRTL